MHNNLSESACVACDQLQLMPCGYARAASLHHLCTATLMLTSLLATTVGLVASDSASILS